MGNKVPFVIMDVALNDVGVFAQNKLVSELKKSHSESEIFPDEHGHYNITKQMLSESSNGTYYDGKNKIFEWEKDSEGCLKIVANTNKQINILADIDAKQCLIEAKGPLFLNGRFKVKNDLIVSADALWISEKLSCKGDVTLISNQGIAILSPFSAKNLSINTSYLHMDTNVDVAGYLDVSSQFFKQGKSCKTISNGLRLITTQAEIAGDLKVSGDSFISANNIILGSKKDEATIQLDGINYIHASNLLSKNNAQLAISRFDNKEPSKFIVDNELIVEKKAIIDFKSTKVIVKKIKNHGEISTVGCELLSNKFYQNGIYDAELSDINIYKQFNQNSRSLSKLTNNNFLCRDFNLYQGRFKFDDCTYEALNTSISGKFKVVNNSKCSVGRNLFLTETADFHVNNSAFSIDEEAYLTGNVSIVDSKLSCNYLIGFSQILLKESDIECKNESSFFQGLQAKNSKVNARKILIKENAVFDNMTLSARNIHFNVNHAQADGISLFAENFDLSGSDSDDKVMFKNGVFILDKFTSSNNATIEKSSIFGVDKRAISHQFYNNLKLVDCCFITESEVRNNKGSSLAIENGSFSAKTLYSVGAMHAKNTTLSVDSFKQDHAEFVADSCKIRIKKELSSTASVTQLKDNTSLLASQVKLGEKDDFTLSQSCAVNVSHKISTSVNSNLKINNSALVTKKFISLGRAEICEGILSADELLIYNRFEAKNKSLLQANKLIAIAKTGRAKLSDAYVLSRDFHSFGKLSVNDTHVLSENNFGLSPGSDTKLSGNTVIKAKNIALNGKVAAKKKDSAEKKSNIQFHATELLYQGNSGVIYGDEDLSLDTQKFLSHGAIDLLASLNIKGKECSNYGMIYANNLHFGFDDSVLNFGSLSAKNMVVHSNFVNFLGKVSARESFSSAGYLSFNFGMIAANNYSNNSLISLNAGLFLPNFSADRKYIFSKSNLMNVAKIGVSSLLPEYKKAINLAFMVPGIINAASDVLNSKENFNFEKYMNMRRHEWMPLVCRVKGYGLTGLGAYKSISSVVPTMFTHFDPKLAGKYSQSDTNASYKLSDFTAGISNIDWKSVGVDIASTFTGNYSDNALIRLNAGLIAVGNASNTSLFDINFGFEGAGLSHCVNTYSAQNFGMIHGVDLNVSARHLTNSGYIVSNDRLSLNADNLNNREKGLILARETDIVSERIYNHGKLKGSNKLNLKADNLYNSERGTITARETDIVSESIFNQGKLKGSNKFTLKADSLLNAEAGVISGNNFYVDAQHLNQQGKLSLKNGQANIDDFTDTKTASTNFTDAYVMGESFKLNGTLLGEKNVLDYSDMCISESANQYLRDATFQASSIVDNGHLNYQGQVCFIADKYTHNGVITRGNDKNTDDEENQNIFYVKSKEAVLNGSGDLDNAYFNIDHFKDRSAFVTGAGIYSNYHISDSFSFETLDSFKFEQAVNRDCDLTVKAADINMDNINYDRKQDLTLISTKGDVSLCSNITSKNLFVKSARDMWTNGNINVDEFVNFSAEGIYTNLGGTVNGDTVAIKAAAIKNISSGSAMAQQAWAKPMGNTGLINGRKNTFIEATQGNIENYGGGIRGGEYCQLIAKGDVLNACNVRTYQGAYDTMQDFDAGLIAGGNGANTDGIGLYIQAGGKIISDASDFISNGINYLEADQGFDFRSRQHAYVSNQWTKKKWYGKKETHIS
uniref:hypothetical protein n=1 Tax=Marivirga sp. TaxID=2018662 RepID=UPI0025F73A7C